MDNYLAKKKKYFYDDFASTLNCFDPFSNVSISCRFQILLKSVKKHSNYVLPADFYDYFSQTGNSS